MSRSRWLLAAAVAAMTWAVGCAHCDTCDDLPVPCAGGNCGGSIAPAGLTLGAPIVVGPATPIAAGAPVLNSQPAGAAGSGTPTGTGAGTGGAGSPGSPPLPNANTPFGSPLGGSLR